MTFYDSLPIQRVLSDCVLAPEEENPLTGERYLSRLALEEGTFEEPED